eukprot:CAMPEP_0183315968 /NCGR_PEP_ID=MMETSP0160_2-20130417/53399_1 /TAXON_ID=2839 ORGANISM="Odontella Sinensis, Strain Grunow 1884" /NCGR_SAMPLE_ID=MMETSP0160_2 /ASSEMBLY_ACC=CAM_ASM_000250 /LENGTH=45 /DNA_ID= /DNA_START= /DNA_END= /DNA_ORIENTATION=
MPQLNIGTSASISVSLPNGVISASTGMSSDPATDSLGLSESSSSS